MGFKKFPVIASRTYEKFKGERSYMGIAKSIMKRLRKVSNSFKRARIAQREVSTYLDEVFKNPVTSELSCKAGCSACCHSQVGITNDEAELLAKKVIDGHQIDIRALRIQAEAGNEHAGWYALPKEARRCVFLDDEDKCSVYEDRPMVCRTNYVFSDPSACETTGGVLHNLRLLNTHKADMVIMAAFEVAESSGSLPSMLWNVLKNRQHAIQKPTKFPFIVPRKDI